MNKAAKTILALFVLLSLFAAQGEDNQTALLMPAAGTVLTEGAALRKEPTKAVPKLLSLHSGSVVSVFGLVRNGEGDWLEITYETGEKVYEGYVLMEYVAVDLMDENGEPVRLPVRLRVSARAECLAYNHVGYNWKKEFFIDGEALTGSGVIELSAGDTVRVSADITEVDAYPDSGWNAVTKTVTQSDLNAGFTVAFDVYVSENRGRYSGYTAKWTVTFRFTRA